MNPDSLLATFESRELRAWQATFAASISDNEFSGCHVLFAPPGTGKAHATIAAVAERVSRRPQLILILTPSPLCEAWKVRLSSAQGVTRVTSVTRRVFREMESTSTDAKSPWTSPGIYVISDDVAKQADIASVLEGVEWAMVVIDEAHRFASPQRAALLTRLLPTATKPRIVVLLSESKALLSALGGDRLSGNSLPSVQLAITDWYGPLKNWDGTLVNRQVARWTIFEYSRGVEEARCLRSVWSSLGRLQGSHNANRLVTRFAMARAASSIFALEQTIARIAHRLRASGTWEISPAERCDWTTSPSSDLDEFPVAADNWISTDRHTEALQSMNALLVSIESLDSDSKLNALRDLIEAARRALVSQKLSMVICCSFADTANYVYQGLEGLEVPLFVMTGSISFGEREVTVRTFLQQGGVLVITDSAGEGLDGRDISDLVHYDLPSDLLGLERRRVRFDHFTRTRPLTIHFLADRSGAVPLEDLLIKKLIALFEQDDGRTPADGQLWGEAKENQEPV